MPRNDPDSVVTQSVLDRLIDLEPAVRSEASMSRRESVRGLKAALRRDLEWLLNTRRTPDAAGEEYPELTRSLFNYGFPDFTTFSYANTKDRDRLLLHLEEVIRLFEPRLDNVRVVPVSGETGNLLRQVRFQIEGMLKMDPAPEQITFDTVLSLTSGEYQVKAERG